jgi:endonuclease YncB( thermonuclease family)
MKRFLLAAFLALCCCALPTSATTLQGLVKEVHDGRTITVENTGRRIKVALKGADAPGQDQPYGDAAHRHLSNLVLNRQVLVEYTGLGANGLLIAKVFCEERDIGLQMIRDGVAWFERSYENGLSEAERRLYADSEQAARNEQRGIWQAPSPMPPWEWRQAQASKRNGRMSASGSAKSTSSKRAEALKASSFSPPGAPFSIRMPGGGHTFSAGIEVPRGQPINANFYWVNHLKIGYLAVWASGPSNGQAISALFDRALDALNEAAEAHGLPCEFFQEKDAAMSGYVGRRYKVRGCYFQGGIRYYFKTEGKMLKVRLVGVMSEIPGDPAIKQFLDSFVINN